MNLFGPRMKLFLSASLLAWAAVLSRPAALRTQSTLEVARGQMAAGHAEDARILVSAALKDTSNTQDRAAAMLLLAQLTHSADSAQARYRQITREMGAELQGLQALDRLGDAAFAGGDYQEAVNNWNTLALLSAGRPGAAQALVKLARAHLHLKQPGKALEALDKALSLDTSASDRGMILYWRGQAREMMGQGREAGRDYLAAYQRGGDPFQMASLSRLGRLYGAGTSKTSGQWRQRVASETAGSVFDPQVAAQSGMPGAPPQTYSIQLGAFSSADRASSLAQQVRRLNLNPVILPAGPDGLYRVRITGLNTGKEMDRVISLLKKNRLSYNIIPPGGKP